jgi:putative transposase
MDQKRACEVAASILDGTAEGEQEFWEGVFGKTYGVIGGLIEAAVETEMNAFTGAGWHEVNPAGRRTTRAGYRERRFTVLGRDLTLRIPRARIAGFRSRFLRFRQRRHADFDRWVVEGYVAGASMREDTAQFYAMFGTSVSPATVSTLVKRLDAERAAFQTRRLTDDYAYLVLDGMYVRCLPAPAPCLKGVPRGTAARKLVVLLVRGIKEDGTRELIDFRIAAGERERAWEDFLRDLFDRGLEGDAVKCFVHDGSDGLENALDSVYGAVATQRCIAHKLGNVWDAVEHKDRHRGLQRDASEVYDAATADQARQRLAAFGRKWTRREPQAVATLRRDFDATLTYFTIPRHHRRWMRTTNPLERTIRELRRRTRPMGTFQGLDSARRLIYVAVKKLSHARRNAVPYSLWSSQPRYGSRRRPRATPSTVPDIDIMWKEIDRALNRGIS